MAGSYFAPGQSGSSDCADTERSHRDAETQRKNNRAHSKTLRKACLQLPARCVMAVPFLLSLCFAAIRRAPASIPQERAGPLNGHTIEILDDQARDLTDAILGLAVRPLDRVGEKRNHDRARAREHDADVVGEHGREVAGLVRDGNGQKVRQAARAGLLRAHHAHHVVARGLLQPRCCASWIASSMRPVARGVISPSQIRAIGVGLLVRDSRPAAARRTSRTARPSSASASARRRSPAPSSHALTRATPPTFAIARSVAVLSLVITICSSTSRSVGCRPGSW